jgi:hypothetical protein
LCIIAFSDTIKYNGIAYSALYRERFLAAIIMELIAKENQYVDTVPESMFLLSYYLSVLLI